MDISFIKDLSELLPGYGHVFQAAAPDNQITSVNPGRDTMLVEMAAGIDALGWVRQGDLKSVLYFGIDDAPECCLSDAVLCALARSCREWLAAGADIIFGCGAGISRSSYANCATLMHTLGISFDDALAMIRQGRPQAGPNTGFVAQLRRLEPVLRR